VSERDPAPGSEIRGVGLDEQEAAEEEALSTT
jgi:hypothetical protein